MSKIIAFVKKWPRSTLFTLGMLFGVFGGFFFWIQSDYAKGPWPTVFVILSIICFVGFVVLVLKKGSEKGENQQ